MRLAHRISKKIDVLALAQGKTWTLAAGEAAVKAQPGLGDTPAATGRQRMSTTSSFGRTPTRRAVGFLGSYQIPGRAEFLRHIKGRRPTDDLHVAMGAKSKGGFFYGAVVERHHHPMRQAHAAGLAALRAEHSNNIRKARRAKR